MRRRLRRDNQGAVAVEFAMLAPVFLTMLLGTLLMGMYLQNINALQSAANDTSRQVTVAYQRNNQVESAEIQDIARSVAIRAPYLLDTDRLDVVVEQAASSRVTGATEFNVRFSYQLIGLPFVPISWLTVDYQRPVFVI
jgi:Flp pilus assembly protein TadG